MIVGEGFDAEATRLYAEGLCTRAAALGVRMIGVGAPDARRLSPGFDDRPADAQCRTFLKRGKVPRTSDKFRAAESSRM